MCKKRNVFRLNRSVLFTMIIEKADNLKFVFGLSISNPRLSLPLGINKERITGSFADNHSILDRQFITWQALKIPLCHLVIVKEFWETYSEPGFQREIWLDSYYWGIHHHVQDIAFGTDWNFSLVNFALPVVEQNVAKFLIEWSGIWEKSCCQEHITYKPVDEAFMYLRIYFQVPEHFWITVKTVDINITFLVDPWK